MCGVSVWTDEHQAAAFEAFWEHKQRLDEEGLSIGDAEDDWGPWYDMFLAGYKKGCGYEGE